MSVTTRAYADPLAAVGDLAVLRRVRDGLEPALAGGLELLRGVVGLEAAVDVLLELGLGEVGAARWLPVTAAGQQAER